MLTSQQLGRIVDAIHAQPEFYGCKVAYWNGSVFILLDEGTIPSVNYERVVVIEENETGRARVGALSGGIPSRAAPERRESRPASVPGEIANSTRVGAELTGAGLSCGMAVISGIGVVAGGAAEIPSGGTSTVLVVAGWAGLVTSGAQCVNGIVRSYEAIANPDDNSLQRWDDNTIYNYATNIVDAIGVVSSVAQLPFAMSRLMAVLERRGALMTAQELSNMSRPARGRAIREALAQASRTPEGRREVLAALEEAGLTERQAAAAFQGANTVRRATAVQTVISEVTMRRLYTEVWNVISVPIGIAVSASPARLTGSGSGSVRTAMVYLHVVDPE